jgi:5-methylcytosine-specific restriction endonuclease McrA
VSRYRIAADGRMVPVLPGRTPEQRFRSTARWQRAAAAQLARQPWCTDCGATVRLSADHVVPLSAGGARLAEANLTTRCVSCNARKGAR